MKPGSEGYGVNGDADTIVTLVRQAVELGADVIEADPTDDLDEYGRAIEAAGRVPVLVRGGGARPDEEILRRTEAVLQYGAAGIVYGRNVVQHADPVGMTNALMSIVHRAVSAEHALADLGGRVLNESFVQSASSAGASWGGGSRVPPRAGRTSRRWASGPGCVVVCDVNPDVLAWYERLDPAPRLVSDYRELLADEAIEAVYCAGPAPPARGALRRLPPGRQAPTR